MSCNQCGDELDNNCNCNIIGCGSATVTADGNDITVCAPNIEVVSPNETINVVKNVVGNDITFEIEKECCPDKLVAACASDTNPGVLFNKLQVDTTGPLTYNLNNCPGDGYVEIGFDKTKLKTADKKVAVSADCIDGDGQGGYLEDVLKSNNSYFNFTKQGCIYQLVPQPRKLLRAEIWVYQSINATLADATDAIFGITNGFTYNTSSIPSAIQSITVNGGLMSCVKIPRDARYQINLQGSYVLSGVHTIRNQICFADTLAPILDSREEGGWRVDTNDTNLIDTQENLNTDIAYIRNEDIVAARGKEMSISTFMRGHGFAGSVARYLTANTEIVMMHKFNTRTYNDFTQDSAPKITFTGRGLDYQTNGAGAGTGRSIVELPEYTLCN